MTASAAAMSGVNPSMPPKRRKLASWTPSAAGTAKAAEPTA